jgi:Mrp family chromosome partitioning ATPase
MSDAARSYPVIAVGDAPRQAAIRLVASELVPPFDERLVLLTEPDSPRANAHRLLRQRLLTSGDPRVILVTSAIQGEGKTTCAGNLALAIAEEGTSSVVLVEANPLRPALGTLFGVAEPPELLESASARSYSLVAPGPRLRLAFAWCEPDPLAHVDRALLARAAADLRRSCDYVIFDAAATLESVSVNVFAEHVDGVVLAARAKLSDKHHLERAVEALAPARVLGAVLLDV